jgi:hypothetical protein
MSRPRSALLALLAVVMLAAGPCGSAPPPANLSPGQAAWERWSPRLTNAITTRVLAVESAARLHLRHQITDDEWRRVAKVTDGAKVALDAAVVALWSYSGDPSTGIVPPEVSAAEAAAEAVAVMVAGLAAVAPADPGGAP